MEHLKKCLGKITVLQIIIAAVVILCAGLAMAGVIHPVAGALPLIGIGAVKVRDDLNNVRTLKYTHNAATTTDTIYYLNGMVLLAMNSALANVENVFVCSGLIEYTKVAAQAWTGGQKIYWDGTAEKFTNVYAVGCILAGYASEPAANPSTTGFIVLDPSMRAASSPSHSIVAAGTSAAEVDADATVVIAIPGAAATDIATATLRAATNVVYVTKAVLTADTLTVTLSGVGGAGTTVDYMVSRAVI